MTFDWRLRGVNNVWWHDASMEAACINTHGHRREQAPVEDCRCGIYGWYTPGRVLSDLEKTHGETQEMGAVGQCSFWGKTIVGDRGVRAQSVQIERLYIWFPTAHSEVEDDLRARYPDVDITVLSYDALLTTLIG